MEINSQWIWQRPQRNPAPCPGRGFRRQSQRQRSHAGCRRDPVGGEPGQSRWSALDPGALSQGLQTWFLTDLSGSALVSYSFPLSDSLDGKINVSVDYRSKQIIKVLPNGNQTSLCVPAGVTVYCASGSPLLVNANVDISTDDNKTVSLFVRNLTNWQGLSDPAHSLTTPFRPRPRTFGVQLEASF